MNQGAPREGPPEEETTLQKVEVLRTGPAEPLDFEGLQQGKS